MSSWASWHPGGAFMKTTRWGGKLITFFIDPVFIAGNTTATAVECRWRPCAVSIRHVCSARITGLCAPPSNFRPLPPLANRLAVICCGVMLPTRRAQAVHAKAGTETCPQAGGPPLPSSGHLCH